MARIRWHAKYLAGLFLVLVLALVLASGTFLWWQGNGKGACRVAQLSAGEDIKGRIEVEQNYFKIGELVPITVRLTYNNSTVRDEIGDLLVSTQFAPFELNQNPSLEICRKGARTGIVFTVNGQILSQLPAEFRTQPIEIGYELKDREGIQLLYVPWPPEFSMKSAITENTFAELKPEKSRKGFLWIVLGAAMAMSIMSLGLYRFILSWKRTSPILAQDRFDSLFPKWSRILIVREKLQYAYVVLCNEQLLGHDDEREKLMERCSVSFAKDFSDEAIGPNLKEIEAHLREWSKKAVSQKRGVS